MMEEQKTNKHFDKMMMKAIQEKYSLFVWQSLEGTVEKCELKIKTYKKQLNSMELVLVKGQEENYSKMIIGNRTLNIFIPELSVSFASEVKSLVENKYIILYPPLSYLHHERRKHQRITPIKPCSLEFEFNKKVMKKSLLDLSLGGLAIVFPNSEKMFIKITKKTIIPLAILSVGARPIKIKIECTGLIEIDRFSLESLPYGGYKISFKFLDIGLEDKNFLVSHIAHEILLHESYKKIS